jgi:hypothetical protein
MNRLTALALANVRSPNSPTGIIGLSDRRSQATNAPANTAPAASEPSTSALPRGVGADQAPGDAERAGAGEQQARDVELRPGAEALGETRGGQRDQDDADGNVEPENPVPADASHDGAADDGADRHAEAGDAAPQTDRGAPLLGRECLTDQGQREREHDRRAGALDGTGGDERARARRERRGGRRGRERQQADRVHAPPPEAITERRAGEQEAGEREVVGIDGPLEALQARVQVEPQGR